MRSDTSKDEDEEDKDEKYDNNEKVVNENDDKIPSTCITR